MNAHLSLVLPALVGALAAQDSTRLPVSVDDVLNVERARVADVTDDGRYLVVTTGTLRDRIGIDNYRYGDPSYIRPSRSSATLIDTRTGERTPVFEHKEQLQGLSFSPDGTRLAFLIRVADAFELRVWDRKTRACRPVPCPKDKVYASDTSIQWLPDGSGVVVALRRHGWGAEAHARFLSLTQGPIVVLSSEQPFLAWESLRRMSLEKAIYHCDLGSGEWREIVPEGLIRAFQLSEDGKLLRYQADITEHTDYDVIFGSNARVMVQDLAGGDPREVIASTRERRATWSPDGRRYAYVDGGDIWIGGVDGADPKRLTGDDEPARAEPGENGEAEAKERFSVRRFSANGRRLIASSNQGLSVIDIGSKRRTLFLPRSEDRETAPNRRVVAWTEDGNRIYLSHASRTEWERGFLRYDLSSKRLVELVKDRHSYGGLRVSDDGRTLVFTRAPGNRPSDVYTADGDFRNVRRLTTTNEFLEERALSETELVDYLDVDGNKLHGVLYYPANYEPGKRYPTIFLVYETFFDDSFNATVSYLTSRGYALIRPSVRLVRGRPGEAWLKGVTAAANKLIDMGIADPKRLGVHGTSYGGYATNLLIAQTDRFKAAINISGKVNMVSFYTDSPRLGIRNIHAPENSQDRIGATLWEQPHKYVSHSAIMDADRIETPLLLITGEQDHNVPDRQAMEMYYALRRLGKRVEWVRYVDGGHGMPTSTIEEVHDYHRRLLDWYDEHLKPSPPVFSQGAQDSRR